MYMYILYSCEQEENNSIEQKNIHVNLGLLRHCLNIYPNKFKNWALSQHQNYL